MKSLEYVKEHIHQVQQEPVIDAPRFVKRFLDFLPCEEWDKYGFSPTENFDKDSYKPKEWTEENVINQLKEDVRFGIEKALNHRGISASLMFGVVQSWCIVLENGLENTDYGWYGDKLFKAVGEYYNWDWVKEDFEEDSDFYKEW